MNQIFKHVCICRRIDCEQIRSRINHEGLCQLCVLYAADEGLRGRNVLQLVVD